MGLHSGSAIFLLGLVGVWFIAQVAADCSRLNNCSGHGTCTSSSTCQCNSGWAGADCSIPDFTISPAQTVTGSVARFNWVYYHLTISTVSGNFGLDFRGNQTGASGQDCDLYVKLGTYPSRSIYDYRDISLAAVFNVTIPAGSVSAGTYYAGIYGFQSCNYNFAVNYIASCPNGCSNQGTCNSGVCSCYPGYAGSDCSTAITVLNTDQIVTASVGRAKWNYYSYAFNPANADYLTIYMNDTAGADADLYVREGSLPSLFVWDYANATVRDQSTINITNPDTATYYIGVYGYSNVTYTIVVHTDDACPNQCSGHGACSNGIACNCQSGFNGTTCENSVFPLDLDTEYAGYVASNAWNYWNFQIDTANPLDVSFIQDQSTSGPTPDCDVYLRRNALPTRFRYDLVDLSTKQNFVVEVNSPLDDVWYIGVYGWKSCSYTFNITEQASCPTGDNGQVCSGNGVCPTGGDQCQCTSSWAGDDCSIAVVTIQQNGGVTQDSVSFNQWNYYNFQTPSNGALLVTLLESNTVGNVWVYASESGSVPTLRDYDAADADTNSAFHSFYIDVNSTLVQTTEYYIGVYGSPLDIVEGSTASYELAVWSPPI